MFERLEAIKVRYEQLTEELSKPEVLGDYNQLKKLSKEQKDLEETYMKYKEYQKVVNNIEEAQMLINDPEMGEMAALELEEATAKKESLTSELEILLIPKDENDDKDIIMEIRGAAGGDEANIFAGDLFRMYSRYADKVGWKIEVINSEAGTAGGFSQIEAKIKGENVYSSNYERLLIPADYTTTKLTIQFSYIIKNKEGLPVKSESNKSVGVGVNFVAGNSYNFMAEIKEDLTPITFTVTSTGSWTPKDQTVTIE